MAAKTVEEIKEIIGQSLAKYSLAMRPGAGEQTSALEEETLAKLFAENHQAK